MKWWYIIVLFLGVLLGAWVLDKYGIKKPADNISTSATKTVEDKVVLKKISQLATQSIRDKKGVKVEAALIKGTVKNWDYENSVIEFFNGPELWKVKIDSNEAKITVPSKADKSKIISFDGIKNNIYYEKYWQTAFCEGDTINMLITNDAKVKFIDNGGYRQCGFREGSL